MPHLYINSHKRIKDPIGLSSKYKFALILISKKKHLLNYTEMKLLILLFII